MQHRPSGRIRSPRLTRLAHSFDQAVIARDRRCAGETGRRPSPVQSVNQVQITTKSFASSAGLLSSVAICTEPPAALPLAS
jgi:hypothetical protein